MRVERNVTELTWEGRLRSFVVALATALRLHQKMLKTAETKCDSSTCLFVSLD